MDQRERLGVGVLNGISTEQWFGPASGGFRAVGKWLFLLLASAYFACSYAEMPMFLDLRLYAMGGERLPYQERMLPMFAVRALMDRGVVQKVTHLAHMLLSNQFQVILALLAFVSVVVAVKVTEGTIRLLTGDRVFAFWSSLLVLIMTQFTLACTWGKAFTTPYDVPSLMFFTIGVALIVRHRWWVYYPVFVLAVINRETACFLTVFLAAWEWVRLREEGRAVSERVRRVVPHVVAQAAIWLALKIVIGRHFAGNLHESGSFAGGAFVTHFAFNVKELLKPQQWPTFLGVCGFSLPMLWIERRWIGCKPLMAAMAVVFGLSFAGLMIVGVIMEVRIYADWIALAAPAVALVAWNRFRPVAGVRAV